MSNFSFSRSGRLYLATQTSLTAAATLAGSNACRHTKCQIKPMNPRSPRNDKTGTLSRTPGIGGLRKATVSIDLDLAANGTPGTKPDCDPILQSLFGQAPTVSAGTSVAYALADAVVPVTVGHYRLPSTVQQQIAFGTVFESAEWGFMDGVVAKWKASGQAVYSPDSLSFSALDTNGKGGLGAFPVEPTSPVTNGSPAAAFQGSITLDGTAVTTLKSGNLKFSRPVEPEYSFGSEYPTSMSPDVRSIGLTFSLWDDDSTYMSDLLQKGVGDAVIGATLVIGNVAGNIWTFVLKGLQVVPPSLEDGSKRWSANFDEESASASSITALDEIALTIT
jgi:hypothetical protein